jgi:hypothetical protein
MTKRQFLISLAFVSVFSFFGGIVGGMLAGGQSLFAQKTSDPSKPQYIERLKCKYIETESLNISEVFMKRSNGDAFGFLTSSEDGSPLFALFPSRKWPPTETFTMQFFLGFSNNEPQLTMTSRDQNKIITISTEYGEPSIKMNYDGKPQLVMGTNHIVTSSTGNEEKVRGSICAFDQNGKVIGRFPSR